MLVSGSDVTNLSLPLASYAPPPTTSSNEFAVPHEDVRKNCIGHFLVNKIEWPIKLAETMLTRYKNRQLQQINHCHRLDLSQMCKRSFG